MLKITGIFLDYGKMKADEVLAVEGASPVAAWSVTSGKKGAYQTACRVKIGTWDSGWRETDAQQLHCDGATEEALCRLPVTVSVRDCFGEEATSETFFCMNVRTDWTAKWLTAGEDIKGRTLYFRKTINIGSNAESAVLLSCGLGWQAVYQDERMLGGGRPALGPAHTNYTKTCQYETFTDLDVCGKSEITLKAIVGSGWRHNIFAVRDKNGRKELPFMGPVLYSAMLIVKYTDGSTRTFVTDESWEQGTGRHVASDIFDGETYDANAAESYVPVTVTTAPCTSVRPQLIPPIRFFRSLKPVASWTLEDGSQMFDFGYNIAGVCRLTLPQLAKGQTITVSHAEELDEDGTLFTAPLRSAKATDTYIASGKEAGESFLPMFTYHGFRYVKVSGLNEPAEITAEELHTDLEKDSFFRCGDARVNAIHEACAATERANQHSILTDCPQRDERQGWMNDATVRFEETPYNFDIGRIFPKIIRDIMDEQETDGAIGCTAPFVFGGKPADPVCTSFLMAGYQSLLHMANKDVIKEAFDAFAAWEECLLKHSDGDIVNYSYYGDWAGPAYACVPNSGGDGAISAVTPGEFMSTCYSYKNSELLAHFALQLGKNADAEKWSATAKRVKAALLDKYLNREDATLATGSMACQAIGLWLDLFPEDLADRAAARLADALIDNGLRFTTGNLCTRYLMDVLAKYGYVDLAWQLLTKQDYPSWGFMIEQEATTIWERFELKKAPGMNSHNHPMYAAVDYFLYAYIAGIRPDENGWKHFTVEPYMPEGLLSCQAQVDTVRGKAGVRWARRYGKIMLHVDVPFGSTCTVRLLGKEYALASGFAAITVDDTEE